MTLRIMLVIGTRPEAIKMAPVVAILRRLPNLVTPIVVVTGQHRQMLDQVLEIFSIRPDVDLDIMTPNQSLGALTARLAAALDEVIRQQRPDWVLVQGDTTSAMVASLLAFYQGVKVGHIEAGLRTHNLKQPFPEELNRRITDIVSTLYFSPTARTRANLLREGVPGDRILITGNTVIDALLLMRERVREKHGLLAPYHGMLDGKRLVLVTSHRRENFGEPFANICAALRELATRYHDVHFIFPVHYNPNVREPAHAALSGCKSITLIDPVDYETMVALMDRAHLILTDSGGVQEEAPTFDKPLLVMREVTERQEVIEAGAGVLVGTDTDLIISEARRLLDDPVAYRAMAAIPNPYGDGTSSQKIVDAILAHHGLSIRDAQSPAVIQR